MRTLSLFVRPGQAQGARRLVTAATQAPSKVADGRSLDLVKRNASAFYARVVLQRSAGLRHSRELQQRRWLASAGGGGGGNLYEKVKDAARQELEKNHALRDQLKQAEEKAGAAFQSAQERAEKLKAGASEQAAKASGIFSERFQGVKERLNSFRSASRSGGSSNGSGKSEKNNSDPSGNNDAENDFVRASKEREAEGESRFAALWNIISSYPLVAKALERTQGFREGLVDAAYDLVGAKSARRSTVVKRLPKARKPKVKSEKKEGEGEGDASEAEAEADAEGYEEPRSGALVIVKGFGEAWEKLQARLKEAPIIQDILGAGRALGNTPVGQAGARARQAIANKVEDAQEAWETSQHPLVYRASSAWDSVTAETEMGSALRELRRLDHSFDIEEWKADVQEALLPEVMKAFLRGDSLPLKEWMGEAVYNKLAAEMAQRKKEGIVMDPNVLDIRQAEVLAVKADADSRNPTIVLQFMCQQINCLKNAKGEVIEGSEDDIRANYYIFAFQRDFLEAEHELRWKIVDFMLVGAFPYY